MPDTLALRRRQQAARRLEPHPCGCRDPWSCTHGRDEPLDDLTLDAWEAAAAALTAHGMPPVLPVAVRDALHRRDSRRRVLELASA
jgi:hypothetical protein